MDDIIEIYGTDGNLHIDLTKGSPISAYSRKGYGYAVEKADFTYGWTKPAVDEIQSLGYFNVEFQDGKKIKIPAKLAIAVQQKYNAMRKPADKEKFQARIGKSYKDMLSALKEELQPKKESILERMNRKIKENKDG